MNVAGFPGGLKPGGGGPVGLPGWDAGFSWVGGGVVVGGGGLPKGGGVVCCVGADGAC
jgi:hypothetical protein